MTGRLYADDSVFDRLRGVADSGYATSPYIGPLSGLAFNSGYAQLAAPAASPPIPAKLAARKLARALRRAGISHPAAVALGDAPPDAERIAAVRSPTMAQLVAATNVPLQQLLRRDADQAARRALRRRPAARGPARRSSSASPAATARRPARRRRLRPDPHQPRLAGCSRPPAARRCAAVAAASGFVRDLAVAGRDGTVDYRMRGTAAARPLPDQDRHPDRGQRLSGYCFNRSGRMMVFSILMNGVRDLCLAHYEQDRIAAAVAAY